MSSIVVCSATKAIATSRVFLSGSVSRDGFRTADFSRELARHRGMFRCRSQQALPHGDSQSSVTQYSGRCERSPRLAHLCRFCSSLDWYRTPSLPQRRFWSTAERNSLCTGRDHDRFVFGAWAKFRQYKGAVKLHTLLDLRGNIPSFIYITDGKVHDINVLDVLIPEPGSFYVMDRGYLDFARLYALTQDQAYFVVRSKENLRFRRLYSHPIDKSTGLRCDQTIVVTGPLTSQLYPEKLRRVGYVDATTQKRFSFLSNNFVLPALTITQLYKCRWQVELFFKWIKQHLRIKAFYGTTENAVRTQVWIAVSVYVLVAILKKQLNLDLSLYTILQILSLTPFEKAPILQVLTEFTSTSQEPDNPNQLKLFNF